MAQIGYPVPFATGSIIAGRFRLLRQLGVGGMGAVYEIEHVVTKHRRALKLLHLQLAQVPSIVERFLREASAASRIGNPHIVETFDAGQLDSGEPYIVMELLDGMTLADYLSAYGPLNVEKGIDTLIQACDAITAAHAAGIVHRDLKPENLFLCATGLDFVKVLDFGISKFDANTTGVVGLTQEGTPLGTPYYMSPEQVNGAASLDGRTDIYALGVILYECLTGRKPYSADTLPHLAVLIFQGNYVPATELRSDLPKAIDEVVARAMAREPGERFSTAKEMAEALSCLRATLRTSQPATTAQHDAEPGPSTQSPPASPALTPDVFSSAAWRQPRKNQSRSRLLVKSFAIGCAAIVAVAITIWQLGKQPARRDEPRSLGYAAIPAVASNALPPPDLAPSRAQPSGILSVASPNSLPIGTKRGLVPTALSGSPREGRTATPASSAAASPKNRASSFGLTEKNPFD